MTLMMNGHTSDDSEGKHLNLSKALKTHWSSDEVSMVNSLYQLRPDLRTDFFNIIDFVELVGQDSWAYLKLLQILNKIQSKLTELCNDRQSTNDLSRFAIITGYESKCVELYRQILREMGLDYLTEFTLPFSSHEMACLYVMREIFVSLSNHGPEFRLCLAQTGFLADLLEDLKHMKHLAHECLETNGAFLNAMYIIHNCCQHSDVVPIARQIDVIGTIKHFLQKKSREIKAATLSTIGLLANEHDLDLLQLDIDVLQQHYLEYGVNALATEEHVYQGWSLLEILSGLSDFARNEFNKRFIVVNGGLKLLTAVLESGTEDEKGTSLQALLELAKHPHNIHVMSEDGRLIQVLEQFKHREDTKLCAAATNLISKLGDVTQTKPATQKDPNVISALQDSLNVLSILGCSEVTFVLNQFDLISQGGHHQHVSFTQAQLLQMLSQLSKDAKHKREIISKGGLGVLTKFLQDGTQDEKLEVANAVTQLVSSPEHCSFIQQHYPTLLHAVKDFQHLDTQKGSGMQMLSSKPSIDKRHD